MKCPLHPNEELVEKWKRDDPQHLQPSFFSHKEGAGWCNGRPAKATPVDINVKLDKIIEMLVSLGGRTQPEPSKNTKPLPF